MAELLVISGKDAVRAFENAGWLQARQESSHVIMKKARHRAVLSIPQDPELAKGTLRGLIRDAEMTVEEFVCFLADR
jgi:predicted RNA binding protein YcfA (HicA-like mRNA interferase family)